MPTHEKALLVNLVGHAAGTLIFSIFLALFMRDRKGQRWRGSWLTVAAASLALAWNAGSLLSLLSPPRAQDGKPILATFSFCALSLLPAVLLHISIPKLRIPGYVLSCAAVALHISEHFTRARDLHRAGLLVITLGFGVLTIISALLAGNSAAARSRLLGSMSLALFAMSFIHFGAHAGSAWANELLFHHAGLPLAVFVLLQDLRFLLVDALLRFLASAAVAGALAFAAARLLPILTDGTSPEWRQALTIGLLCAAMLIFAALHASTQDWLTRRLFRRPDVEASARRLRSEGPEEESAYLEWAVKEVAAMMRAPRAALASSDPCGNANPHPASDHQHGSTDAPWVEAFVPISGNHVLLLGGGRHYLSEDYEFLGRMAAVIRERLADIHDREAARLVSEAELKSLQAQINPHFLFNALNAIYGSIPRTSPEARKMVRNLSDIFRHSLQSGEKLVTLARELEVVNAYLEIERLRFPDRLRVEIDVDPAAANFRIPALTLQPLVENAIKHAISLNPDPGLLTIRARIEDGVLDIEVTDSGSAGVNGSPGTGIGITNVRRRLELSFGPRAAVEADIQARGSKVRIAIPTP